MKASHYRWAVLFASFFAFVAFAFSFQLMPPLFGTVQTEFGVGDAEIGLLMSIVVVPGIILALPSGLVINRYGFRTVGFLSTVLVALGSLATALADTFLTVLLGRFVLGVGAAFLVTGLPAIIRQWFSHEDLGKAMGIYSTNMPAATIAAFPTATVLSQTYSWQYPFFVAAAVGIIAVIIFGVAVKEGPLKGHDKPPERREVVQALRNAEVWKASLVWMCFNITAIAFLSWAPTLFQDFKGLDPFSASVLASALMYAAVVFVPIYGWASDKVGKRKPFIVVGAVGLALALIATAYASDFTLLVTVAILGVAAAMVPPIVMTIPAQNLPPNLAGTGFSVVTLCQNIGVALAAPLAGYFLQATGSLSLTFLGVSMFTFAGAVIALSLKTK